MIEQEMWQAVLENDAKYDGVFYYAVKTTGIYCKPSCKSKPPKKENICFFETSEQAVEAGFRPCKRCRSDLIDYQPMKQIAKEVKQKIDLVYREQNELNSMLNEIGMSGRRLTDIFKDEYGLTPKAYADHLKLEDVKYFLEETDKKIVDIAYAVGFESLSAFYYFFKRDGDDTVSLSRKETE